MSSYMHQSEQFDDKIIFHGFINRQQVHELYKESHFFLFPSYASEGFPKVIAEACAFGCMPITSEVASIGHYIKDGMNGYYWRSEVDTIFGQFIIDEFQLKSMNLLAQKFTFEKYSYNLKIKIFNVS